MLNYQFSNRAIVNFIKSNIKTLLPLFVLSLFSYLLYLKRIPKLTLFSDGFYITYLQYQNQLPNFWMDGPKEPGRPFMPLAWNLAYLVGQGSVQGYNLFMGLWVTANSLLIFCLARLLLGKDFTLIAFLAAFTKLVWIANHEIYHSSSLGNYFAESLFLIACLTLSYLKRNVVNRYSLILPYIVMFLALLIALGIYQTVWAVALLFPVFLIWIDSKNFQSNKPITLFAWYFISLILIAICSFVINSKYIKVSTAIEPDKVYTYSYRLILGLKAVTFESLWLPIQKLSSNITLVPHWFIGLLIACLLLTILIFGKKMLVSTLPFKTKMSVLALAKMLISSLVLMVATLLPICIVYAPVYGSRFIHWASLGTIMLLFSVAVYFIQTPKRLIRFLILGFLCLVILSQAMANYIIGENYENLSFSAQRFWISLINNFPSVTENTYIAFEQAMPQGIVDYDCTSTFRVFTGTHSTACFVEQGVPFPYDDHNNFVKVKTRLNLTDTEIWTQRSAARYWINEPREISLPKQQVIWLRWDQNSQKLVFLPDQVSKDRVLNVRKSSYGTRLFPNYSDFK